MNVMKSVAYSYISGLDQPFALDVVNIVDGQVTTSIHEKFATLGDFYAACEEGVIQLSTSPQREGNEK